MMNNIDNIDVEELKDMVDSLKLLDEATWKIHFNEEADKELEERGC